MSAWPRDAACCCEARCEASDELRRASSSIAAEATALLLDSRLHHFSLAALNKTINYQLANHLRNLLCLLARTCRRHRAFASREEVDIHIIARIL